MPFAHDQYFQSTLCLCIWSCQLWDGAVWLNEKEDWSKQDCNCSDLIIVHSLYQGILYFKNVMCFWGTCINIILFTPVRKVHLHCADFLETHKCWTELCAIFFVLNFTNIVRAWEVWTEIHLCLCVKYVLDCTDFHKVHSLTKLLFPSRVPNFIQTGWKM